MDWCNELYVRLYKRETTDDMLLSWEARALWHEMLKKFDRSGIIRSRRGAPGLAALVKIPLEVVERALTDLLEDGRVAVTEGEPGWIAPNFMAAQEAIKAGALRQKEYRDRHRKQATGNESSRIVTGSDGALRGVTKSDSELIRTELNRTDSVLAHGDFSLRSRFEGEYERRRVPEDPSIFMVLTEAGTVVGLVQVKPDGTEVVLEDRSEQRGLK